MYKLCGLNDAPGRLAKFVLVLTVESFASTALGMAVGSLAPSVEAAIAIAPSVMVIFIVFGGQVPHTHFTTHVPPVPLTDQALSLRLYVVNTPAYLSWVPSVSLIRWAYEALCINEFTGLELVPGGCAYRALSSPLSEPLSRPRCDLCLVPGVWVHVHPIPSGSPHREQYNTSSRPSSAAPQPHPYPITLPPPPRTPQTPSMVPGRCLAASRYWSPWASRTR